MQWLDAYPDAKGYVCPGGKKKYPNVRYSQELSEDNQAPPEWLDEIEPTFLSYEAVPLLNIPFFNEVCLCSWTDQTHRPGRACMFFLLCRPAFAPQECTESQLDPWQEHGLL